MRSSKFAACVCLALFAGCSSSGNRESGTGAPPPLSVSVSVPRAKADGTTSVNVTVSGATSGPIKLTTTNGVFANGTSTEMIDGVAGSATLTTCDARTTATCTGNILISARSAGSEFGTANVVFYGFEEVCDDGRDDNSNGVSDCADVDCDQRACSTLTGLAGTCQSAACVVPVCVPAAPETGAAACSDGLDGDCDGKIDCSDTSCEGSPCKAGSPSFVCQASQCVDGSSGLGVAVTPARSRLPADGVAVAPVSVKVTSAGSPAAGVAVTVTTTAGAIATTPAVTALTAVDAVTDATGTAVVYFKAPAAAVRATVTAAVTAVPEVSHSAVIEMPVLGALQLSRVLFPVMGARSSGINEQNVLTVVLLDADQKPYPDGLGVRFQHAQLGGSELAKPWAPDSVTCRGPGATPPGTCIAHDSRIASPAGAPDSTGEASVNLYSGTLAGSVTVTATATAGGKTLSFAIPNLAITGAKPSGAHVAVDCSPRNVPALTDDDCRTSFYDGAGSTITCTAYFADRFENVLGIPASVQFQSENGASSPPSSTVPYDPTKAGGDQTDLGKATGFIAVTGYDLPFDVEPLAIEQSRTSDLGCGFGVTTQNPRDGISAIVAMTQGEEGFVDGTNGHPRDGAFQPGEDFIDVGEPFIDANDSSARDPGEWFLDVNGNGVYDPPNGAWDSDTMIWAETRVAYTGWPGIRTDLGQELYSRWFTSGSPPAPTAPAIVQVDSSAAGQTATTESVPFFFTDRNLNPPSPTLTAYAVSALGDGVSVEMLDAPLAIDRLPMDFTQVYCDQHPGIQPPPASPRVCANHCAANPCYVVTNVGAFEYGSSGVARVKGGSKAGATETVRATATLREVKTHVEMTATTR
jgi:hypothetical protein